MKVTDELIDYVSSLARLSLSDDEKAKIKDEISKIIDYMDILNQVDPPMWNLCPMCCQLPMYSVRMKWFRPYDRDAILAKRARQ